MTIDPIQLAQDLIRCPSITPQDAGVMDVLQGALASLGFTVTRKIFHEDGFEDTENLYARLGTQAPNLCFAGHTDVVPVGDEAGWRFPPFEPTLHGGHLYGRGAEDMKGAVACFVTAVSRFLQESRVQTSEFSEGAFAGSISLLITNDEEGIAINGTKKMLEWLAQQGEKLDACVVGEPTNPVVLGEMLKVGRRGSLTCTLSVRGKQGHVAYPELADNPVTHLVAMLHALKSHTLDEGTEFFPPSNLEVTSIDVGNPAVNVIPAVATAKFNIRFNNLHTGAAIEQWIHDTCKAVNTHYELHARLSGEAFLTENKAFTDVMVAAVQRATGRTPKLSTTGGTSDARFIKDYCPVVEFGTTGRTPHMVDENVSLDTLMQLTDVYVEMLRGYFSS